MLNEGQQLAARTALEAFFYEDYSDPIRVSTKSLHNLQTILAEKGLTIASIAPPLRSPVLLTADVPGENTPADGATQPSASPAPVGAATLPQPPRLGQMTPTERGVLITAERAATAMQYKPGSHFKSDFVFALTKIIRRVCAEPV